jgi:hypothetical protein
MQALLVAVESRSAAAPVMRVHVRRWKDKPAPKPSPTPTPTPTPTPALDCLASLALDLGTPWRAAHCSNPGYTNHLIPGSPALNATETAKVRTLSSAMLNIDEYTEPIFYASPTAALRTVKCVTWGCVGGSSAPLTGNERVAPGTDAQVVVIDRERRRSYELWAVAKDADGTVKINADGSVTAGSMSVVDLDGRGNKTADGKNLNITGAGVSRIFGIIRANEVRAAAVNPATAIPHALQVSLPTQMNCSGSFREPATKTDGRATGSSCVQEGARVQMDPGFNCGSVSTKMGRAACFAMQKYGAYVMDNNGSASMAVYAQHQRSWASGKSDYAAVGIGWDYQNLGLPMNRLRVLGSWTGR